MLYARITLSIKQKQTTSDSRVVLYRGDYNVDIEFILKTRDYILDDVKYAQVILSRPFADSIFSDVFKVSDGKVTVRITGDMIDDMDELESYAAQIRLYDGELETKVTLPPCYDILEVRKPMAVESYDEQVAMVNYANTNYSMITREVFEAGETFTDGYYNKTNWKDRDLITDGRLNKIEDALYIISEKNIDQDDDIKNHTHDLYLTEHQDISHLATKREVNDIFEDVVTDAELEDKGYVTNEEIEEKGYLTEHQDISHLATQKYVEDQIANLQPSDGGMTEGERAQLNKNTSDIEIIINAIDTPPTYTKPTFSMSANPTTIQHNKQTSVTISPSFKKNDAGDVVHYTLWKNNVTLYDEDVLTSYVDSVTVSHNTSVSYTATITYADGIVKNTVLGVPYPDTSIKSGDISSSTSIKAYALSYYGIIDKAEITDNDISSLSSRLATSKSYTYTVSLSEQRIIYMYPQSFGALTSIKDANNFDYINSYTRTTMTYDSVDYYIYILTDPVTISGFKQIFS